MKINERQKTLKKYVSVHRKKRRWLTAVTCLAAGVVFCTTYALILPAITLENHQTLDCAYELHRHKASCYDAEEKLNCGYADYAVHTYQKDYCYDEDGNLSCELAQMGIHEHNDSCYEWTEELICGMETGEGGHQHTAECYETKKVLTCSRQEIILHTHSQDCYEKDEYGNITEHLTCGLLQVEEHQHDVNCITSAGDGEAGIALTSLNELPDEILSKLADEAGIYPGTANADGTWTVYDTGNADDANIKATVTLPEETMVAKGHYLYIREVAEDENYYPNKDALKAVVGDDGAYSDVQCYAIHWVYIYQENGEWKYTLETDSVLGGTGGTDDTAPKATVQIEYLNGARLQGASAHRKLQVLNSRNMGGTDLEDASTPTAVTAADDAYTGFTFMTNRGGPYVFVSKTLYEGYVESVAIDRVIDGSAPFDDNNSAGNDSDGSNKLVRSYDVIQYDLIVNMAARSSGITSQMGMLEFEMTMETGLTEAVFNPSQMLWLGSDYTIEYLDKDGNVVLTQNADGKYHNANGTVTTVNDIVSGSDRGQESYTGAIVTQRLRGMVSLQSSDENGNILTGNKTYGAVVQVLNAANQSKIQPTFRVWFKGNEDNYGSENPIGGTAVQLAEKITANKKIADAVTVSSAARFNLQLAKNTNTSYKSWFDSGAGQEISRVSSYVVSGKRITGEEMYVLLEALGTMEENIGKSNPEEFTDNGNQCREYLNGLELNAYRDVFQNIRYGRITGYGITLQVYNDATGEQNDASKGFKGVSLPQGSITFDLALGTTFTEVSGTVDKTQYSAQMWEYNENVNESTGNQKKNMYWAHLASTQYAAWAAPYNSGSGTSACYNGGIWKLGAVNGDGSYSFTVSGYDFNFLTTRLEFPTHRTGNSGATTGFNTYIGSFSAGYVQLLNVFPRTPDATFTLGTSITVKNLEMTTTDGQKIATGSEDATGYAHETNTKDNSINDTIPLYAPGGMTKANAFCNAACFDNKTANFSGKEYFLGTDFWGTSYDCSAFAGQKITLVGAARMNAGDYVIKHMNMLQLFDSRALSIDTGKGQPFVATNVSEANTGTTKILYAADPHYPEGYDTNAEGMQEYMSRVREEDLKYYTSLDGLENDGYICVGVLAELRGCTIYGEGGYSTVLKIPMTVSQEEKFLTKTVSTVNTVRIWTNVEDMENGTVSWADGIYNVETGKNFVDGYTAMAGSNNTHYRGEVANGHTYVKTEYKNGQVTYDTNAGGYVYGSSLLILGYESTVDIEVDNGGTGSLATYDMDKGSYTVNYHLKDIIAKVDNEAGLPQAAETNLTVLAKLDTAKKEDSEQRISVAAAGYQMKAASKYMQLVTSTANDCGILDSVNISTDPGNPTTVYYRLTENLNPPEGQEISWTYYTIQVYAQPDTSGFQVNFKLTDVTVGASVPDIIFDALIDPEGVENNDRIEATAYISGTSDVRAYTTTNGNLDSVTIGIIKLRGTNLVKTVDQRYIELDGVFTYTVTYANIGNEPVSLYLYDLLPAPDDIRGSAYDGANSTVTLRDVSAALSGGDEFTAEIQFYYSMMAYTNLYDRVSVFGSVDTGTGETITDNNARREQIETMLGDTRLFSPLGTIGSANNHQFIRDGAFDNMTEDEITGIMRCVTGIYAVVENLGGGRTLSITFTLETKNNEAGDLYRNNANSWLGDDTTPLTSNLVETTVVSRTISGVVWHDSDLDGVRDSDETLLSGVTCTLFKWNEESRRYEVCATDITGEAIPPAVTGEDGAYSFEKLAAGEYVVAFSGDALAKYTGSTIYQVNGSNNSTTNDGVTLAVNNDEIMGEKAVFAGIESSIYRYAIAYSLKDDQAGSLSLHTIRQIVKDNVSLVNGVELYANQDLGIVYASHQMPQTGGTGTTLYTIGGLMAIGAGMLLLYKKRRRTSMSQIQSEKERMT